MADFDLLRRADGLAELVLGRPPVNALTPGALDDVAALLAQVSKDNDVRALVITARGRVFSAGMDLAQAAAFTPADEAHANRAFTDTFAALYAMPKPVVAAVGGAAIAGGFFFAAAADWTVATDAARFGLAEVAVGAPLPLGPLEIARAELTPAAFRRLLLTGTPISAEEAAAAGLVDEFAEPDTLAKTAFDRAKALAAHLPAAYAATKADLRRPTLDRIAAGREASLAAWFVDGTRDRMRARLA